MYTAVKQNVQYKTEHQLPCTGCTCYDISYHMVLSVTEYDVTGDTMHE